MFLESFKGSCYSPAYKLLYRVKGLNPGVTFDRVVRIGRARVVLKRTVVGESD